MPCSRLSVLFMHVVGPCTRVLQVAPNEESWENRTGIQNVCPATRAKQAHARPKHRKAKACVCMSSVRETIEREQPKTGGRAFCLMS